MHDSKPPFLTEHTYVNPLPLPSIPRGKDDWYPFEAELFSHKDKPASVTGPDYLPLDVLTKNMVIPIEK